MRPLLYIICLLLFIGCQPQLQEHIVNTHADGSPRTIVFTPESNPNDIHKKVIFYANGNLRMVSFFKSNKKSGKWLYFYENGNKMAETHFKKNLKEGASVR